MYKVVGTLCSTAGPNVFPHGNAYFCIFCVCLGISSSRILKTALLLLFYMMILPNLAFKLINFLTNITCVGTSDRSGTHNLGFGFWKWHGEIGLRQV